MKIGIIGYGRRMQGLIRMVEKFDVARVQAIADPNFEATRERFIKEGQPVPDCKVYRNADEMLAKEDLDAVMVGTRCSLHAKMGMKVLAKKLPLYLEKPIATNRKDLAALAAAGKKAKSEVVVSFPLKVSPLVTTVKEILDSGKIGAVETIDAWNDPPYGAVYYRDWYRDECETGGLWLQKATHDFDYLTFLVGARPKQIAAMTSKRVFKGSHAAGLKCRDCDEGETCLESPFHLFYTRGSTKKVEPNKFSCMFAKDTGNEDSGHAIVEYDNGVQVVVLAGIHGAQDRRPPRRADLRLPRHDRLRLVHRRDQGHDEPLASRRNLRHRLEGTASRRRRHDPHLELPPDRRRAREVGLAALRRHHER